MSTIGKDELSRTPLAALWDTTRMRLLVEIDRCGTLSAAARAIGIGQSSASEHVRLLELAAGQALVERDGRGSRLTVAGAVLAGRAAQALAALGAGDEELAALAGIRTGTIHVGASTAPGVYLLPEALGAFRSDYPEIQVQVEIAASDEILERLLAGRVQLAIVGAGSAVERIELEPFIEDEIVGVARPGLLQIKRGAVDATALEREMLLAREAGSSTQSLADAELRAAGVEPFGTWELGSSEAVKRAARAGLGFAFLSRFAVAEEVERSELERFRLAHRRPLTRWFSIARLAGRQLSPGERAFVDTLRRVWGTPG